MEIWIINLFLAGALGALVKEIIQDNELTLPKIADGKLALGFLGSCFIGAIAGYLVDGDPVTAGLAGYAGLSVIENFLVKKSEIIVPIKEVTEAIIRRIAKEEGGDPDLAVRVAKCESNLDCQAVNINTDSSRDRGLFQINEKWHPEVSDEEAFNPITATQFFCKACKAGNLSWWDSSKKCWEKQT